MEKEMQTYEMMWQTTSTRAAERQQRRTCVDVLSTSKARRRVRE